MSSNEHTHMEHHDDQFDLIDLIQLLWKGKYIIAAVTIVFAVGSVAYSLTLPNIYKAEAILSPVNDSGGLKLPSQLGSLAAMAGVSLGGSSGSKTDFAIELLKSRDFISRFIERNELNVPVIAAEGWDLASNRLLINKEIYDESSKTWVREVVPPFTQEPSVQEVYSVFKDSYSVVRDKTTGMVSVSIEHYSPVLAHQWLQTILTAINEEMRQKDLDEAQRSIDYLNDQLAKTHLAEIKTLLHTLIQDQIQVITLANVRAEYTFRVVDKPIVAEEKIKPKRSIIAMVGTMSGFLFGILFVFFSQNLSNRRSKAV
ncbi:Wzz/FepE/Etk N-terminal domain-containing protein [Rheinheimera sp.]|uniref:Wzz/FepE/Etk N-terminal domain-containing protein n=1 Tax=Rheinheimera sp. TaxID=1869214 RepID=UPI003AF997BF